MFTNTKPVYFLSLEFFYVFVMQRYGVQCCWNYIRRQCAHERTETHRTEVSKTSAVL